MPRPVRNDISRSDERPPINTATFTRTSPSLGTISRRAQAREAALPPQKLRHPRQLGAVRPPGEGDARRLEQLATLESERPADRLDRGFNPLPAPLRKRREGVGERGAQFARPRALEHGARLGLEGRRILEEG